MRIISCHIENFGKLSDVTFCFEKGCNGFCEENGWGKSTLAAFIKAMFYGFEEEKSRDEFRNERKRYRPWQGGVYGGSLELETEKGIYLISRVFGQKEKEDSFSIRKKDTNLECRDYSSDIGEELFRLDCGSFCRTVFISQNDCETATTDSISAKIGNLAENTDDINNYENVSQKLAGLLLRMSPTRKTGALFQKKVQISGLEEKVRSGILLDKTMEETRDRLDRKLKEQEELKGQQEQLLRQQKRLGIYKDFQAKKQRYEKLCEDYEKRRALYQAERRYFPGEFPKKEEFDRNLGESSRLAALEQAVQIYGFTDQEKEAFTGLRQKFLNFCPDRKACEEQEENLKQLQAVRMSIAADRLSEEEQIRLQGYEQLFGDGVLTEEGIEGMISEWSQRSERKNALIHKKATLNTLKNVSDFHRRSAGLGAGRGARSFLTAAAWILGIFGILGLLGGILLMGKIPVAGTVLLVFGLVLLLIGGVLAWKRPGSGSEPAQDEGLLQLQEEISGDEAFIAAAEERMEQFFAGVGLSYEEGRVTDILYGLKSQRKEYQELAQRQRAYLARDLEKEERRLTDLLLRFLQQFYPFEIRQTEDLVDMLDEVEREALEYTGLLEKQAYSRKAEKELSETREGIRDYIRSLSLEPQEDLQEQLLTIQRHMQILRSCAEEYQSARDAKALFEKQEDMETIKGLEPLEGQETLEEVSGRLEAIALELEKAHETIMSYRHMLDQQQEESDRVAEAQESLTALREEYQKGIKKYELLGKTKELLEQAKISFTSRYTEPIRQGFLKYYRMLTGQEGAGYYLDANTCLTVEEKGMQREPRFFSTGYRDLMGICMRMALVDAMYQEEKPFLVLDDPFCNLDGEKLRGAMRFLEEVGKEYQILYFTCHNSRLKNITTIS